MNKRISFIRNRQQMNNPRDLRDGAYMVYDCEADSIYPNNTPNCNPVDRDEGAERVGMGVLLAKQYLLSDKKDNDLKSSLLRYANFSVPVCRHPNTSPIPVWIKRTGTGHTTMSGLPNSISICIGLRETDSLSVTVTKRFVPCFASSVMAFTASVIRYV